MGVIASRPDRLYSVSEKAATIKGVLLAIQRHLYWTRRSKFNCHTAAVNMFTCKCWAVENGERWLPTWPSARTQRVFTCHSNEWSLLLLPRLYFSIRFHPSAASWVEHKVLSLTSTLQTDSGSKEAAKKKRWETTTNSMHILAAHFSSEIVSSAQTKPW